MFGGWYVVGKRFNLGRVIALVFGPTQERSQLPDLKYADNAVEKSGLTIGEGEIVVWETVFILTDDYRPGFGNEYVWITPYEKEWKQ